MIKFCLSLFLGTLVISSVHAKGVTTQSCELAAGSGPFKSFTVKFDGNQLKAVEVEYTEASGRIFKKETLMDVSIEKRPDDSELPELIISIDDIDDWGSGTINLGSDESEEVTALATLESDSGSSRGVYGCTEFPAFLFN